MQGLFAKPSFKIEVSIQEGDEDDNFEEENDEEALNLVLERLCRRVKQQK